ncbi:MAG: PAS domain S-box protein [Magnetococcales bacterium]|nr:PAS domain S-box protein [Magnetococcales bacterium]MBF0114009.1 PAS domain S-box protein [Magnetococcales bacterium]
MFTPEKLSRWVVESAPCGIVVVDEEGCVRVCNQAAAQLFAIQPEQILGQPIHTFIPPELHAISSDVLKCCLHNGQFQIFGQRPFVIEALRQDGSHFPAQIAINQLQYQNHSLFVATVVDVTEEKNLLDEIIRVEKSIIDNAPFGIIVTDEQAHITHFNIAAEKIFHGLRSVTIGRAIRQLIPSLTLPLANETPPDTLESEALRLDGTSFPVRLAVNRLILGGKISFILMIADITEEKRLYNELVQSEKMAGLGSMVAGVAHEINTPVGIGVTAASELDDRLLQFRQLLDNEGISEEELRNFLDSSQRLTTLIRNNLNRAADLVRSFKAVAVDQSSEQWRTIPLREYLNATILTLQHPLRHSKITITLSCPEDLRIRTHAGAWSQILLNLINNSLIHAFDPQQPGAIHIDCVQNDAILTFFYRDDGKGMDHLTLHRLYEPFFTTRRDLGGSGLGMHIVYNLVTQTLNGSLSSYSAPQKGFSLRIKIPVQCVT